MNILFNKKIILISIFISMFFVTGIFNVVYAQILDATDFSGSGLDDCSTGVYDTFGDCVEEVSEEQEEGFEDAANLEKKATPKQIDALDETVKRLDGTYIPTKEEEQNIHDSVYGPGGNFTGQIQDVGRKVRSEFTALNPIPGVTDAEAAKNPSKFFNGMFMFGISIAAFLAVLMIAVGGIQYMSTDAVSGKSEGRERITYAIMGLLLVLFSWILLRQINPEILNFDFLDSSAKIINLIIYV